MEEPVEIKFIIRLTDPKFKPISDSKRHIQYVGNKMAYKRQMFRYFQYPEFYFKLWLFFGYLQKIPDVFPYYNQIPLAGRAINMSLDSQTLSIDYFAGKYSMPLRELQIKEEKNTIIVETIEGGKFFIPRRGVKTDADWQKIRSTLPMGSHSI